MNIKINIYNTTKKLFKETAILIFNLIEEFISLSGSCTFVLSGGSTPIQLYEILGNKKFNKNIQWDKVYFFWGDERCVLPDSNESNFKMAYDSFLSNINIPDKNIFRIFTEMPHMHAALDYEVRLKGFFQNENFPSFDIILLGLGEDGHTASLFPGTNALKEKKKWVVDNYVESKKSWRITMTLHILNNAKNIIFLVSGKEKANAVKSVLKDKDKSVPAAMIQPKYGNLIWCLDKEAGMAI